MRLPAQLFKRKLDSHKSDFGHLFILAGSSSMLGAAALTAKAALRCGAGLVTVGVAKSLNTTLQKKLANEVMTKPLAQTKDGSISLSAFSEIKKFLKNADVLAIGPGLSRNPSTQKLIRKIIAEINLPMVIDADGLNALIGHLNLLQTTNYKLQTTKVLTPHPGEMARLLDISIKKVESKRKEIAQRFARNYKVTVVLKGHNTVVADYKNNLYINTTGNPGMATAGSGDILTGMIAAFLAQGLGGFNSAKFGVYLHGLAGDLAVKEKTQMGLIASDIIEKIPEAIKRCS